MKIQGQQDYGLNPVTASGSQVGTARPAASGNGAAEVNLTPQGQELHRLTQHIRNLPEPLSPRAAQVQAQIAAGTYKVSGADVAAGMMKRLQSNS